MRASLLVGLLAVALAATACSSAPDPSPFPSSTAGGLITQITNPEAPFEVAWTAAVGDDGSAVVVFLSPSRDGETLYTTPVGIALVYRDGTYDTLVDPTDERHANEWPMNCFISDTTVAWTSVIFEGEQPTTSDSEYVIYFWDRESRRASDRTTMVTEGALIGEPVKPWGTSDLLLVGEVLFWTQTKPDSAEPQELVLAADGDGRVWTALDADQLWFRLGHDTCASTPGHPVLWAIDMIEEEGTVSNTSWQIDASDPASLRVIKGSEIPLDPWREDYRVALSLRCGDDLLTLSLDDALEDANGWPTFILLSADTSAGVDVLDMHGSSHSLMESALTQRWIVLGGSLGSLYPRWIIHRSSASNTQVPSSSWCPSFEIHGDFVSWETPQTQISEDDDLYFSLLARGPLLAMCDTYIGVLTEPVE